MAHIHHEEEQRFSNVRWIWGAFVIILLVITILALTGEVSQKDLPYFLVVTPLGLAPVILILLYSKLQIKIDGEGVHYKFIPSVMKWKTVSKKSIESFEVTVKKNLWEKIECGYGRNRLNNTISMNISGEKYARIKLTDGRKLKIGTINPESMERALRKLTAPDNY